jgi:hypothetical protein
MEEKGWKYRAVRPENAALAAETCSVQFEKEKYQGRKSQARRKHSVCFVNRQLVCSQSS